jgi:hypothetical protein
MRSARETRHNVEKIGYTLKHFDLEHPDMAIKERRHTEELLLKELPPGKK